MSGANEKKLLVVENVEKILAMVESNTDSVKKLAVVMLSLSRQLDDVEERLERLGKERI